MGFAFSLLPGCSFVKCCSDGGCTENRFHFPPYVKIRSTGRESVWVNCIYLKYWKHLFYRGILLVSNIYFICQIIWLIGQEIGFWEASFSYFSENILKFWKLVRFLTIHNMSQRFYVKFASEKSSINGIYLHLYAFISYFVMSVSQGCFKSTWCSLKQQKTNCEGGKMGCLGSVVTDCMAPPAVAPSLYEKHTDRLTHTVFAPPG